MGSFVDAGGTQRGYLRDGSDLTTFDGPAGAVANVVFDISDNGQMVGVYIDQAANYHAYSLRKGRYTAIDVPGAPITLPYGGEQSRSDRRPHPRHVAVDPGLRRPRVRPARRRRRPCHRVDVPGAVGGTTVLDINNHGAIAGIYGNPAPAAGLR